MAAKTRPKDWLRDEGAKAWGKLVALRGHVDLTLQGGMALRGPWVGFDKSVVLVERQFLVVAAEHGELQPGIPVGEYEWTYRYKLVTARGDEAVEIPEADLYQVLYRAMEAGMVPDERVGTAVNNWLYVAAVYCVVAMEQPGIIDTLSSVSPPVEGERPKRRLDRPGNRAAQPAAPAPAPVPAAKPPAVPEAPPEPRPEPELMVPIETDDGELVVDEFGPARPHGQRRTNVVDDDTPVVDEFPPGKPKRKPKWAED